MGFILSLPGFLLGVRRGPAPAARLTARMEHARFHGVKSGSLRWRENAARQHQKGCWLRDRPCISGRRAASEAKFHPTRGSSLLGLKRQDWAVKRTIELRRGFGARDRAENAAIAKKVRPDRRPAGRRMNSPQGGRAGLFLQEMPTAQSVPALAIGGRDQPAGFSLVELRPSS